jgi:hypothetical protein
MVRSKMKSLSAYEQVAIAIERFLQSILAIVALGVVYRYCWFGVLPPFPVPFAILYTRLLTNLLCRYLGSLQMRRASQ